MYFVLNLTTGLVFYGRDNLDWNGVKGDIYLKKTLQDRCFQESFIFLEGQWILLVPTLNDLSKHDNGGAHYSIKIPMYLMNMINIFLRNVNKFSLRAIDLKFFRNKGVRLSLIGFIILIPFFLCPTIPQKAVPKSKVKPNTILTQETLHKLLKNSSLEEKVYFARDLYFKGQFLRLSGAERFFFTPLGNLVEKDSPQLSDTRYFLWTRFPEGYFLSGAEFKFYKAQSNMACGRGYLFEVSSKPILFLGRKTFSLASQDEEWFYILPKPENPLKSLQEGFCLAQGRSEVAEQR